MPGVLTLETPFKTIAIEELHPTFGAEITGVDFENLSHEQLSEIVAAMAKYGVCVFRNTGLSDETHIAFSSKLGELDSTKRYFLSSPGRKMRYPHYELFDAGNLDENNQVIPADSPRAHSNRGNGIFHVDSSFNPRRSSFSLLRAVTIPPRETGGNTDFADSRSAWDDLDEDIKKELLENDWIGCHSMGHSRKLGSPEYFKDMDPSTGSFARHRIVQRHEPSGRINLYIGAHLHHLEGEGMTPEKSAGLVQLLNKHATQDKYTISVAWDQPGDMIIWDNRCVLHRASTWTGEGKYSRDMRRTTVHDDSPTAWGLNAPGTLPPDAVFWRKGGNVTQSAGAQQGTVKA